MQLLRVIPFSGVWYLRTWWVPVRVSRTYWGSYHCTDQRHAFPCSLLICLLPVIGYVFAGLAEVLNFCGIVRTHFSCFCVACRSLCFP